MTNLRKADIFPYSDFHLTECTVGDEVPAPQYHDHDFYEILIVKSGSMCHCRNDEKRVMDTDCLALVYPKDRHYCHRVTGEKTSFANIAFTGRLFDMALENYSKLMGGERFVPYDPYVQLTHDMAKQMISRFRGLNAGKYLINNRMWEQMMVSIITDTLALIGNKERKSGDAPLWLKKACDTMAKDENCAMGLSGFLVMCGKSQEHVTRMMKKYYNQTPTQYINSLRLSYVASQLTDTSKSILDITLDAGFQNMSYFNKLFREKYHMTPSAYRSNSASRKN